MVGPQPQARNVGSLGNQKPVFALFFSRFPGSCFLPAITSQLSQAKLFQASAQPGHPSPSSKLCSCLVSPPT